MSVQEVLQKEVFNVKDIETLCQCKKAVAYKIIRQIKTVSDRLGLTGKVHKKDYEDYINRTGNKKEPLRNLEAHNDSI